MKPKRSALKTASDRLRTSTSLVSGRTGPEWAMRKIRPKERVGTYNLTVAKTREIPWPRMLAEGTAIVVSILLAFAIDAWWEEHREAAVERAQLQSLLDEFKEARSQLELQVRDLENSLRGTVRFLELMGPKATSELLQDTRMALRDSLDIGVFSPQQGTLQDVLASPGNIAFVDALVRLGIPMSALIRAPASESQDHSPLYLPESEFKLDVSTLLQDPGVETVFTMRAVRSQILIQSHEDAIRIADEIAAQLQEALWRHSA